MKNASWIALTALVALSGCSASKEDAAKESGTAKPVEAVQAGAVERSRLLGAWVQDQADGAGIHQGFELADDGSAKSINTATLTYKGWELKGDSLILNEQSTGSGGTSAAPVAYRIASLSSDGNSLELIDPRVANPADAAIKYRRERPEEKAKNERFGPAVQGK